MRSAPVVMCDQNAIELDRAPRDCPSGARPVSEAMAAESPDLSERLMVAVLLDDSASLGALLGKGADLGALYNGRMSLMALAVRADAGEALKELLRQGSSPAHISLDGKQPIHNCCEDGRPALLEQLLLAGADPNATDSWGRSPLHIALRTAEWGCLRALLEFGANPNQLDPYGEAPLLAALRQGSEEAIVMLMASGADAELPGPDGESPLDKCKSAAGREEGQLPSLLLSLAERELLRAQSQSQSSGSAERSAGSARAL